MKNKIIEINEKTALKKTHRKPYIALFLVGLMFIMSISLTFALTNTNFEKDLNKIRPGETTNYGKYYIYEKPFWNLFGNWNKISEISLDYNTEQCLIDCEAGGNATLYKNISLFDDVKFKDKTGNLMNIDSYQYYIKTTEEYEEQTPIYKEVCEVNKDISNKSTNSTGTICHNEIIDYRKETKTREVWKEYQGEVLPAGSYEWKLVGKKKSSQSVDFIPVAASKELDEWAPWYSNWTKVMPINLTENNATTLTNYTILLNVTYDSDMQADFDDLRFTESTKTLEIPYWIESKVDGASAIVWVKVPTITASTNTTIYMFYGNPNASSSSTIKNAWDYGNEWTSTEDIVDVGNSCIVSEIGLTGGTANADNECRLKTEIVSSLNNTQDRRFLLFGNVTTVASNVQLGFSFFRPVGTWTASGWWAYAPQGYGTPTNMMKLMKDSSEVIVSTEPKQAGYQKQEYDYYQGNWTVKINSTLWSVKNTDTSTWAYTLIHFYDNKAILDKLAIGKFVAKEPSVSFGAEQEVNSLSVTLNSPEDYYISSSQNIIFNCSATDETGVLNLTLIIDGQDNYTITNSSANKNLSLQIERTLSDGTHNWTCRASDGTGIGDPYTASVRYLTIDVTPPQLTIISPTNNQHFYKKTDENISLTINYSITELNPDKCWYNSTLNSSITYINCSGNSFVISTNQTGKQTIFLYINDTLGNFNSSSINMTINSIEYNKQAYETSLQNINIYFYNLSTSPVNSILNYNNQNYTGTITDIGNQTHKINFQVYAPSFTSVQNVSFYATTTLVETTTTTQTFNQTINLIPALMINTTCPSGYYSAINFSFYDETNLTQLDNMKISYNILYGISNSSKVLNSSITGVTNLSICINSSINNYSVGYGEIQYERDSYVARRYYLFTNLIISNSSPTSRYLYDLLSSKSTSFLTDVKTYTLSPYVGYYVSLMRWYPGQNQYSSVEMSKTDKDGKALVKVEAENVDYRVALYDVYGNLIQLDSPVRFLCLSSPCTYYMRISGAQSDYFYENNIQSSLTYDSNLKKITYVWNDPAQKVTSMTLLVSKLTGFGVNLTICNETASGYFGVLNCELGNNTGTFEALVFKTASPSSPFAKKIIEIKDRMANSMGLFIGFAISLVTFFIGIFSPIASIIIGIAGLVIALAFASITMTTFVAIAVLGGIVIHLIKSSQSYM